MTLGWCAHSLVALPAGCARMLGCLGSLRTRLQSCSCHSAACNAFPHPTLLPLLFALTACRW